MRVKRVLKRQSFPGSAQYWEARYRQGGTSGSGSYHRLAEFKAGVINTFVKDNRIASVIEFGCGDGNQLSLAQYPSYIGLDVAPSAIARCAERFAADRSKSFFLYSSRAFCDNHSLFRAELALSLDVLFHLVEDDIFECYMRHLFAAAEKYVIIYASNFEKGQVFHERDRHFTRWVELNLSGWALVQQLDNIYPYNPADPDNTSKADFFFFSKEG